MRSPIRHTDLELLSAYLDDELPTPQRARLEARLAAEPALRAALEDLRRTVAVLRAAPELPVPRHFTLDPALHRRRPPWWVRFDTLRLTGLAGAAAALVFIAAGLFLAAAPPRAAPAGLVAMEATDTAAVGETAPLPATSTPPTADFALITASPTMRRDTPLQPQSTSPVGRNGLEHDAGPTEGPAEPEILAPAPPIAPLVAATPTATLLPTAAALAAQPTPEAGIASMDLAETPPPGTERRAPREGALEEPGIAALPTATAPPPPTATALPEPVAQVEATAEAATEKALLTPTVTSLLGTPAAAPAPMPPESRLFIVVGIMLLLVSLVILGIVWTRSRL